VSGIIGTAIYARNVPTAERVLRALAGLVVALVGILEGGTAASSALAAIVGVLIAATGFVGFCPACYLMGRRLTPRKPAR
jgi:ABC-type transport system involved in multi-copper enzyme maturation permease subunit